MSITPLEITLVNAVAFTTVFEYVLMDQDEGLDWFVPSFYVRKSWPRPCAWIMVILIAIISPFWAIIKFLRWLLIKFLKEDK